MRLGSNKIVSVEDSDTDFMALQFALKAAGVSNPVERCVSGRAAKENLLAADDCPLAQKASIILLDLNLPEIDGRLLLKELRARDPNREVPLIVLSTSSHPRDMEVCYRAGADAYLVKPFELDDWQHKVGALADYWLKTRRPAPNCAPPAREVGHRSGVDRKTAKRQRGSVNLSQLTRAIEAEIIPRLLLAYGPTECRETLLSRPPNRIAPTGDAVAELARLAIEHDVNAAAAHIHAIRDKGASLENIYQDLVSPAARLVGDLWKADVCTFQQFSQALDKLQRLLVALSATGDETMH
jgi:CheY-like chemotaxis protein